MLLGRLELSKMRPGSARVPYNNKRVVLKLVVFKRALCCGVMPSGLITDLLFVHERRYLSKNVVVGITEQSIK